MNNISISQIKQKAKESLGGKWGKAIGIFLAYILILFSINIITLPVKKGSFLEILLELAIAIINIPITFGISYAYIKLKRNENVGAFDFLEFGFSNFSRAWKIRLRILVKLLKPFLVGVGCALAAFIIAVALHIFKRVAELKGAYIEIAPSIFFVIYLAGLVGIILAFIWLFTSSLLYGLTSYVAYDNKNKNSLEVVNESARLMKGNRGTLILLELLISLWYLIPAFITALGLVAIGRLALLAFYVFLSSYMQVLMVCFYDELIGKISKNNIEEQFKNNEEI